MRLFYEKSSAAKMLTSELSYRYALRHMSNMEPTAYQLRKYNRDGSYDVIDTFITRKGAEVAKSFADVELGQPTAIVGVHPFYYFRSKSLKNSIYGIGDNLSEEQLNYLNSDKELTKGVIKNVVQRS